jgi:hypothetical protein
MSKDEHLQTTLFTYTSREAPREQPTKQRSSSKKPEKPRDGNGFSSILRKEAEAPTFAGRVTKYQEARGRIANLCTSQSS